MDTASISLASLLGFTYSFQKLTGEHLSLSFSNVTYLFHEFRKVFYGSFFFPLVAGSATFLPTVSTRCCQRLLRYRVELDPSRPSCSSVFYFQLSNKGWIDETREQELPMNPTLHSAIRSSISVYFFLLFSLNFVTPFASEFVCFAGRTGIIEGSFPLLVFRI